MGTGCLPYCLMFHAAECMDQQQSTAFLGNISKYSIYNPGSVDCGFVLQKRKGYTGSAVPFFVAGCCDQLCMLYTGSAVCGYNTAGGNADDTEDLCLCLGSTDWL